jgi:hypothetical protein
MQTLETRRNSARDSLQSRRGPLCKIASARGRVSSINGLAWAGLSPSLFIIFLFFCEA